MFGNVVVGNKIVFVPITNICNILVVVFDFLDRRPKICENKGNVACDCLALTGCESLICFQLLGMFVYVGGGKKRKM